MDCKKNTNIENCNCTYPCAKKGVCCDCIENHRKRGELPACYFPDDVEKSYDRSIERFIELFQQRDPWWN